MPRMPIHASGSSPELRKDLVSGEWVLIAAGRSRRPDEFAHATREKPQPKASCPFEDPQKTNSDPLLWYPHPESTAKDDLQEWFVQVIQNKYPALIQHGSHTCATKEQHGIYKRMRGVGYHEVIITKPHERSLGEMSVEEASLVVRAYRERYAALDSDPCVAYILIFHNHGKEAGASISHPHSQLIALPIIPPDVKRSFRGSERYAKEFDACIHCAMIASELHEKKRIVYENDDFLVLAPYASRTSFELRIYPKAHDPHFELISEEKIRTCAAALVHALGRLHAVLNDPAYNFFIHTTPANANDVMHYHWHIEILPKTSVPAGLELGTGVDVVVMPPEDVPGILA